MKGKEALSGLQITSAAFIFIPHLLRAVKVYAGEVCLAALGLRVLLHWGLLCCAARKRERQEEKQGWEAAGSGFRWTLCDSPCVT